MTGFNNLILNLTQHSATDAQIDAGVVNVTDADLVTLKKALTFDEPPTRLELIRRRKAIMKIASSYNCQSVMLGGAPYLCTELDLNFSLDGYTVLYSFSKRISIEFTDSDTGEVTKTNVFQHIGWVKS
jgi:hypothetical protein